jgi:hypothetical protein
MEVARGIRDGELFKGCSFSWGKWNLEVDGGDYYTTMWIYLILQNCTLKSSFFSCVDFITLYFFFFGDTGVWTQGFLLLSHVSSPFCSDYSGTQGLTFCLGWPGVRSSYFMLSTIAGMTSVLPRFFLLRWSLANLFAWASLQPRPFWCQPVT